MTGPEPLDPGSPFELVETRREALLELRGADHHLQLAA
jgi:hypothetical protein